MSKQNKIQIYATFEQAQRMKDAGFNKECVFHCTVTKTHINIFYRNVLIETLLNDIDLPFTKELYLPTLPEVELPESIFVYKEYGLWHFASILDDEYNYLYEKHNITGFETEFEARINAHLWAKRNNLLS